MMPEVFRRRRRSGSGAAAVTLLKFLAGDSLASFGGTFARATSATYFDNSGVLQTATSGTLRDGHFVSGVRTFLIEDTRTNVALWNRDLTNVAWTKTNATAVKDQTGIDGVATAASSLVATAANGTCLQTITLASSQRFHSAYVKRITGTGAIQMTTDGGTTWTTIAVTGAWTRLTIPAQTVTNPSVGFRIVTSGDKIAVDYVQNETGTFASSAIATTTVSVTRNADDLTFPDPQGPVAVSLYADFYDLGASLVNIGGLVSMGASFVGTTTCFRMYAGSGNYTAFNNAGASSIAVTGATSSINDRVEVRATMDAQGSVQVGFATNGGSETLSTQGGSPGLPGSYSDANIYIGRSDSYTSAAFRSVKVVTGVQSLATMQGV